MPQIRITGSLEWKLGVTQGSRWRVEIDGAPIGLPDVEYKVLTILSMAKKGLLRSGPYVDPTGWVNLWYPLLHGANTPKYVYRLKQRIFKQIPSLKGWKVVVAHFDGWYCVDLDRDNISIDTKAIAVGPLPDLAMVAKRSMDTVAHFGSDLRKYSVNHKTP